MAKYIYLNNNKKMFIAHLILFLINKRFNRCFDMEHYRCRSKKKSINFHDYLLSKTIKNLCL